MSKKTISDATALLIIVGIIVGGAIIGAVAVAPSGMSQETRDLMIGILSAVAGAVVLIWIISFGVRSGLAQRERDIQTREPEIPVAQPIHGFPVVGKATPGKAGPRKFFVCGVRRDTTQDVTVRIDAETEANARAKGELQGIIVTEVLEI